MHLIFKFFANEFFFWLRHKNLIFKKSNLYFLDEGEYFCSLEFRILAHSTFYLFQYYIIWSFLKDSPMIHASMPSRWFLINFFEEVTIKYFNFNHWNRIGPGLVINSKWQIGFLSFLWLFVLSIYLRQNRAEKRNLYN